MSEINWDYRHIRLDADSQDLLRSRVQGLLTVPNRTGALYYLGVQEDGQIAVFKNSQPDSLVPVIRLEQKKDEAEQAFESRVSLFHCSWTHKLAAYVQVAHQSAVSDKVDGFTLIRSQTVSTIETGGLAVYVQVLCHARP